MGHSCSLGDGCAPLSQPGPRTLLRPLLVQTLLEHLLGSRLMNGTDKASAPRELMASQEADQNQMIQTQVKPHLNRRHQGQVCQGDQGSFSEEVTVKPVGKVGQD